MIIGSDYEVFENKSKNGFFVIFKCNICKKKCKRGYKTFMYNSNGDEYKNHFCSTQCGYIFQKQSLKGKNNPNYGNKGHMSKLWKEGKLNIEQRMGEKNGRYIDGRTPRIKRIRLSKPMLKWAKKIKERDNFECQICGKSGGDLRSNHIKRFIDYPQLRFDLTNGITICRSCDIQLVLNHEEEWESYFNFNLMSRGIIYE